MKSKIIVVVVTVFLAAVAQAQSGDIVSRTAVGEAELSEPDARVRALDRAFASAVREVTAELLPGKVGSDARRRINRDIYQRARRFIASYRVDDEQASDDRLRIQITARVARGAIRDALGPVDLDEGGDADVAGPAPVIRPKAILVGEWVASGEPPIGLEERSKERELVLKACGELGLEVVPSVAGQAIEERARQAGAGAVITVSLRATDDGPIRATSHVGATAEVSVKVYDIAASKSVVQARGRAAGYGAGHSGAAQMAASEALIRAFRSGRAEVDEHWPKPLDEGLLIRIYRPDDPAAVAVFLRQLAASRTPIEIRRRRMRPGAIDLLVGSELSPRRLAALVSAVQLRDWRVISRGQSGERVEVELQRKGSAP